MTVRSELLVADDDRPALIEASTGTVIAHAQLRAAVDRRADQLGADRPALAFLGASPTIDRVVDYLALTYLSSTVALLDPSTAAATLDAWIEAYAPEYVAGFEHVADRSVQPGDHPDPADDAVLLPTSGSTGSPKFVRLSAGIVLANASQIATALQIDEHHRAMAHLPLFYSYGLSILNSHLVAGACSVLCDESAIRPEFWQAMTDHSVTSLPGVPYNFEMYRRMRLTTMELPALRDVTQAGGKLAPERIEEFRSAFEERGIRFWIMYGQTEATARISVLPHDRLAGRVGSVGQALPGGELTIVDADAEGVGAVSYRGPNVMQGYAERRADLAQGDQLGGVLDTGDLGRLDDEGNLWITGRAKRIAKVIGTRVSLDDLEAKLAVAGHPVAAVDDDDGVLVFVEGVDDTSGLPRSFERILGLPARSVRVRAVEQLPTTASGKIDYQRLRTS